MLIQGGLCKCDKYKFWSNFKCSKDEIKPFGQKQPQIYDNLLSQSS